MKPTLTPPTSLIQYGGKDGLARALLDHVRRQPLEVRSGVGLVREVAPVDGVAPALLHALELGHAVIELVVADAGGVQLHRVERLDGGLVVEQPRQRRRSADEVARGHGQAEALAGTQLREGGREVLRAASRLVADRSGRGCLQMAVVVVERQQLKTDEPRARVAAGTGRRHVAGRRGRCPEAENCHGRHQGDYAGQESGASLRGSGGRECVGSHAISSVCGDKGHARGWRPPRTGVERDGVGRRVPTDRISKRQTWGGGTPTSRSSTTPGRR